MEDAVPSDTRLEKPATWPKSVLQTLDGVVCALAAAFMLARSRAAASGSPIIRILAQRDSQAWDNALSRREADVLRGRLECMEPQSRPYYAPEARFEILQIMRLRRWNILTTAARFVIHPNTLRAWLKELNAGANTSRLFSAPINRINEAGRWLVHQIRELCPEREFGTRAIAMQIIRLGKQISRSSVQRILREKKPRRPGLPSKPKSTTESIPPHHILRPEKPNCTWHLDLPPLT